MIRMYDSCVQGLGSYNHVVPFHNHNSNDTVLHNTIHDSLGPISLNNSLPLSPRTSYVDIDNNTHCRNTNSYVTTHTHHIDYVNSLNNSNSNNNSSSISDSVTSSSGNNNNNSNSNSSSIVSLYSNDDDQVDTANDGETKYYNVNAPYNHINNSSIDHYNYMSHHYNNTNTVNDSSYKSQYPVHHTTSVQNFISNNNNNNNNLYINHINNNNNIVSSILHHNTIESTSSFYAPSSIGSQRSTSMPTSPYWDTQPTLTSYHTDPFKSIADTNNNNNNNNSNASTSRYYYPRAESFDHTNYIRHNQVMHHNNTKTNVTHSQQPNNNNNIVYHDNNFPPLVHNNYIQQNIGGRITTTDTDYTHQVTDVSVVITDASNDKSVSHGSNDASNTSSMNAVDTTNNVDTTDNTRDNNQSSRVLSNTRNGSSISTILTRSDTHRLRHQTADRLRRQRLRGSIYDLSRLLPTQYLSGKYDQANIVKAAVVYINDIQKHKQTSI